MMEFSALLEAAKGGDRGARAELHRRFVPHVLVRVRQRLTPLLRRRYDTLDVGQSVFVELLGHLDAFEDRGEAAFRHWLLRTAENKIRSKLRKNLGRQGQRRESELDGEVASEVRSREPGPDVRTEAREEERKLREVVRTLTAEERRLLQLRSQERHSFGTIAGVLSLPSADAARMRYARLLARLQERWAGT